jgi:hypothetical protein
VVDAKQVQKRGLKVAYVNRVLDDVVGKLVGFHARRHLTPPPAIQKVKQRG